MHTDQSISHSPESRHAELRQRELLPSSRLVVTLPIPRRATALILVWVWLALPAVSQESLSGAPFQATQPQSQAPAGASNRLDDSNPAAAGSEQAQTEQSPLQTNPPPTDNSQAGANDTLQDAPDRRQPNVTSSRTGSAQELRAKIIARQSSLQNDTSSVPPEDLQTVQSLHQRAITALDEVLSRSNQAEKWRGAIATASQRLSNEQTHSEQLNTTEPPPLPIIDDVESGKRIVGEISRALSEVSDRLASLNREEANRVKRKQEIPELISKLKAFTPETPPEIAADNDTHPLVVESLNWAQEAEQFAVDATIREYELELQAYASENALLPLQIDDERKLEARLKQQLQQANTELDALRNDQIQSARYAAQQALKSATYEKAKQQLQIELEHIDLWQELTTAASSLQSNTQRVSDTYDEWSERLENTRSRIEVNPQSATGGATFNAWIGLKLRNQREDLPSEKALIEEINKIKQSLQNAEAFQYTLEDEQKELLREKLRIDRALAAKDIGGDANGENALQNAENSEQNKRKADIEQYKEAIDLSLDATTQMRQDVEVYITALIDSATKHADTISLVKDYRTFIDQHILWIRSAQPLSLSDTTESWKALTWIISYENWRSTIGQLWSDITHEPWWYVLFAIGMYVLVINQASMRRLLGKLSEQAARPGCADFSLTYRCTLLTLAISTPLALTLLFLYWRLKESVEWAADATAAEHSLAIGAGFALAAGVIFPLEVFRQVCRPNGLATHHFGWSMDGASRFRTNLRWFIDLSIPCIFLVGILASQADSRREVALGRVVFIVLMMICAVLFLRLFNPRTGVFAARIAKAPDGWLSRTRFAWFGIIVCLPPAIAITSAVGYHYTAQRIALHLNATLWMLVALSIAYCLLSRWLLLNRRKLIVAQARARLLEAAKRETGDSEVAAENAELDVLEINDQTKRLIRSLIVTAGIIGGYVIWADVLPAIDILRDVTVWSQRGPDGQTTGVITLADALLVIPVIALVVIASRNVPGLLEIALLQHLPLTSAAKYAVTTLCRYIIIAAGIIACSNQLSIRWETVQWLVAALGVGLGFGLQEIFANFVSGIILLFEQPLRVGDIITIDGTTGTVSKIRMRATTIVNWDRQELIVPNKDLITGKLLNWTLSDTTNRIVINVGVAYGSDMDQACGIIREICQEHETVMSEPGPLITFEGFGDNTLNIVVRAFLSSLDNRLGTIHGLHEEIYRKLNDAGIEIAFPQRDLHIRSFPQELAGLFGNAKESGKGSPQPKT